MSTTPDATHSLADRARALLDGGTEPRSTADLAAELDVDADELDVALEEDDRDLLWLFDDTWLHTPTLTDGLVATHVLSQDEIDAGVLHASPDLALLDLPNAGPGEIASPAGLELELLPLTYRYIVPDGGIADARPGDAVVVRAHRDADWTLEVVPADAVEEPLPAEVADLREVEDEREDSELELSRLLVGVALHHRSALERLVPFSELLAAAGIATYGDYAVPRGVDPDRWRVERLRDAFDPRGIVPTPALDGAIRTLDALRADIAPGAATELTTADLRAVDAALASEVTTVLVLERLALHPGDDERLDRLVTRLLDASTSPSAGTHVLAAVVAETRGDVEAEEAALDSARRADATFAPALLGSSRIAEDRGDPGLALRLLQRGGFGADEEIVAQLRRLTESPYDVGRNAPCPCGSGRKHKQCHGAADRPLSGVERARWLLARLEDWALRPAQRTALRDPVSAFSWRAHDPDTAFQVPIMRFATLIGGDMVALYRERRGALLGPDDRAVVDSWVDGARLDVVHVADDAIESALDGRRYVGHAEDVDLVHEEVGGAGVAVAVMLPVDGEGDLLLAFEALTPDEATDAAATLSAPDEQVLEWFGAVMTNRHATW